MNALEVKSTGWNLWVFTKASIRQGNMICWPLLRPVWVKVKSGRATPPVLSPLTQESLAWRHIIGTLPYRRDTRGKLPVIMDSTETIETPEGQGTWTYPVKWFYEDACSVLGMRGKIATQRHRVPVQLSVLGVRGKILGGTTPKTMRVAMWFTDREQAIQWWGACKMPRGFRERSPDNYKMVGYNFALEAIKSTAGKMRYTLRDSYWIMQTERRLKYPPKVSPEIMGEFLNLDWVPFAPSIYASTCMDFNRQATVDTPS